MDGPEYRTLNPEPTAEYALGKLETTTGPKVWEKNGYQTKLETALAHVPSTIATNTRLAA